MTRTYLLAYLLLCLVFGTNCYAQPGANKHRYYQPILIAEQHLISREQAIAIAKKRHPGRVLSAELEEDPAPPNYRVKILSENGRVKTVRVNAQSKAKKKK